MNLLATVDIPIVILDRERRIRRFTPKARSILNVLPADVGRPLDDIKPNIDVADLDRQVAEVIDTMAMTESEVQDRDGRWYRMQIRPYKTTDNKIDGAILSLVDIDALKHLVAESQQARGEAEHANRAKDLFLAVLGHELRTPLASLLLQAQLLRRGKAVDAGEARRGSARSSNAPPGCRCSSSTTCWTSPASSRASSRWSWASVDLCRGRQGGPRRGQRRRSSASRSTSTSSSTRPSARSRAMPRACSRWSRTCSPTRSSSAPSAGTSPSPSRR